MPTFQKVKLGDIVGVPQAGGIMHNVEIYP